MIIVFYYFFILEHDKYIGGCSTGFVKYTQAYFKTITARFKFWQDTLPHTRIHIVVKRSKYGSSSFSWTNTSICSATRQKRYALWCKKMLFHFFSFQIMKYSGKQSSGIICSTWIGWKRSSKTQKSVLKQVEDFTSFFKVDLNDLLQVNLLTVFKWQMCLLWCSFYVVVCTLVSCWLMFSRRQVPLQPWSLILRFHCWLWTAFYWHILGKYFVKF